jgi:Ca2+-binding EF-hand superfamily protein
MPGMDEEKPQGDNGEKDFQKYMAKVFPNYSKEDILKIGEHSFRVFDSNGDGKLDFLEFMVVYNIIMWKEPKIILVKLFDIFDVDKDDMISKAEMEKVVTDLAVLFEDPDRAKETFIKAFSEMDENGDGEISREEFVAAVLEDNKFSQNLAMKVLDIFLQ